MKPNGHNGSIAFGDEQDASRQQTWIFYVCLRGTGENREDAWDDAVAGFMDEPGAVPENTTTAFGTAELEAKFLEIGFTTPLACRHADDED